MNGRRFDVARTWYKVFSAVGDPDMKTVTLYTRRNCCLCHEARDAIESVAETHPLELRIVDIDRDLAKDDPRRSRFAIDIPVVEIDGSVVFQHRVDAEALGHLLLEGSEHT